jgi:hypothetical protein
MKNLLAQRALMSESGTNLPCRSLCLMSGVGERADDICSMWVLRSLTRSGNRDLVAH